MARIAKIILVLIFFMLCSCACAENLRVISLYPGHSDNIVALGGENLLVALSENDNEDLLPDLPRLSLRDDAEKFLALRPDIVVTRSFAERLNPNLYEILKRAGVKVINLDPPSWNEFENYLKTLAGSLGLNPESALARLHEIKNSTPAIRRRSFTCFIEATSKEIHTCAPASWAANLLSLAGGINIADKAVPLRPGSSIAAWGVERVLKSRENLDTYIIQTGAMNSASIKDFYERGWAAALTDSGVKVFEIPERYLSRPSLLGLERGLNELRKIFAQLESDD